MSPDKMILVFNTSMVVTIYAGLFFSKNNPGLRRRLYVMTLMGFALCGWAAALAKPEPLWLGGWILNFTFQNALLAAPPAVVKA